MNKYEKAYDYIKHKCESNNIVLNKDIDRAIKELVDKSISRKPLITTNEDSGYKDKFGKILYFYCPNCKHFLFGIYEESIKKGYGISKNIKGCHKCLQAINFNGYYQNEHYEK